MIKGLDIDNLAYGFLSSFIIVENFIFAARYVEVYSISIYSMNY